METKNYIAQRIKEFRESRKLKQSELGAMLNPPKGSGTVSSWENGRTTPDADTMINLCQIFGVDISDFYPHTARETNEPATDLSLDERELVDIFSELAAPRRKLLLAVAEAMLDDDNEVEVFDAKTCEEF